MFDAKIYIERRKHLATEMGDGLIVLAGNKPVPMNYPSNTLRFRQDSNFLYYCGLDYEDIALTIDCATGQSTLYGDDLSVSDIVWEGERTSVKKMAEQSGVDSFKSSSDLQKNIGARKDVHILPVYRDDQKFFLQSLLNVSEISSSKSLIACVIKQRSIKSDYELSEISSALEITSQMHSIAMRSTCDGLLEQEIVGLMEGYALQNGSRMAYPVIFTINGEILHSNVYDNVMKSGDLALNDSGAESPLHYASDITRTFPVSGRFTPIQKDIYDLVYEMQQTALEFCKPKTSYKDAHLAAAKKAVMGLTELGLMSGDPEEAVSKGAHALFFPHGLGHMLGLDVHDMEGLGEDLVGYDDKNQRSDQFGLAYLRFSKDLEPGFVLTVEPGIYFISHLIDQWKADNKLSEHINYAEVEKFKGFGGIRIEDNIAISDKGYSVLGPHIPKTTEEIEDIMQS
tara:strand:+ start:1898 stop:3262 length:1365 start_codon:yes stop_codon:yes gene_type:complete